MIKLYQVSNEGYSASDVGQLRVNRKWGLPGVICSICQETWAQVGIAYPSVDLSSLPGEEQYRSLWPIPLEDFEKRRRPLLELIPDESVPPPGTELGPLVGIGHGAFDDFVWVNPWTLLAQSEAFDRLRTTQVKLPKSVPTRITLSKTNIRALVELELEPRTLMARSAFADPLPQCLACRRVKVQMPEQIVVQQSSIPSDIDVFRDRLVTTVILATEQFVESVKHLGLTGLEFREIEVAK